MRKKILTSNKHHNNDKYLFVVGVGGNIAEANAGQRGHREVESGYVG
jgi:hypothetical protein